VSKRTPRIRPKASTASIVRWPVVPWVALGLVLLALALRVYRIDVQSYWHDEGNSRVLAGQPADVIWLSAAADIHPPGYYLALSVWRGLLGESEFALRAFSALVGAVLVAIVYRAAHDALGRDAGLFAAALTAVHAFLVYYAQEARMYSLLATLSAAALWLGARVLASRRDFDWRLLGAFTAVVVAGLYTHYAFGFSVIALNVAAVIWYGRAASRAPGGRLARFASTLTPWLGTQAAALIVFAPWLPIALRQLTSWPAERAAVPVLEAVVEILRLLVAGPALDGPLASGALAALMALAAMTVPIAAALEPERRGVRALVLAASLAVTVTALISLGLGLLTPTFAKFLIVAVPGLALSAAVAFTASSTSPRRWLAFLPGAILLGLNLVALNNVYFNPAFARDDYRGIAARLRTEAGPQDAVLLVAPNQIQAFGYYYGNQAGDAAVFPLPATRPLEVDATLRELEQIADEHRQLHVLYWADQQADPERVIERWLSQNTYVAGSNWVGSVRVAVYGAATSAPAPSVDPGARFGEHIHLVSVLTNTSQPLQAGETVAVALRWRTEAELDTHYSVFLHLASDPQSPPLVQQDGEPQAGFAPTTDWVPDDEVHDLRGLRLPADLAPGRYQLILGLYGPDGTRLPVVADATIDETRLLLGVVEVDR
jgi:hypothetical protein